MFRRLGTALFTFFVLVSIVNSVCQAQPRPLLTHHVREAAQNGQAGFVGRLPAEQPMRLVIVLPLRNQAALDQFLKELYNPASPSYRHYLTVEEFTAMFGPTQEDYDAVVHWAESNGLHGSGHFPQSHERGCDGSVATIEAAFHVNMGLYQHPTENRTFYAPDREPTVDLPFQLWHIAGLDNYSIPRPALMHQTSGGEVPGHDGLLPGPVLLRQRHESGLLRGNSSHRRRPIARVTGVCRHRFD